MLSSQSGRIALIVHIEKTAGTSVRYAVEKAIGKEHFAIYSAEADRLSLSSENLRPATTPLLDRARMALSNPVLGPVLVTLYPMISGISRERIRRSYPVLEIPTGTKVIMGHFSADKFMPMLENPLLAVVVREPFARVRSHYDHWKRNRGYEDWRIHVPFVRGMTLEEYAMLPQLQNYQTQALGGIPLSRFDIVGVTEHTEDFTERLLQKLAEEGLTLPGQERDFQQKRMNITPEGRRSRVETLNEQWMRSFREFHAQDYALYQQAVQLATEA